MPRLRVVAEGARLTAVTARLFVPSPSGSMVKVVPHSTSLASGERTCIDCHAGIAHRLPDLSGIDEMIAIHGTDAVPAVISGAAPKTPESR